MNIHEKLIHTLRVAQRVRQHPLCLELSLLDDNALIRKYFVNYRVDEHNTSRGLRLSDEGLVVMKCHFACWTIHVADDQPRLTGKYQLSTTHLLYLDRTCTMPWHCVENHLTLFEPNLAMKAKLLGDLELLRTSFK